MPHSDAEGPEELWYKKGERWAGVREDSVLPAVSSSPLPAAANLPWDLMQDCGSVDLDCSRLVLQSQLCLAPRREVTDWECLEMHGRAGRREVKQQLFGEKWGMG